MAPANPPPLLAVGRLARAHGIRGRVLVPPYNDASDALTGASALWLARVAKPGEPSRASEAAPRRYAIAHAEKVSLGFIVQLEGMTDRNAAEALRGMEVSVSRDELPELDEGELYAADLVGLAVFDQAAPEPREKLGEVIGLEEAGPNELLQLRLSSGEEALAPFALIHSIDEANRALFLDVPQGLFEAQRPPRKGERGEPEDDDSKDGDADSGSEAGEPSAGTGAERGGPGASEARRAGRAPEPIEAEPSAGTGAERGGPGASEARRAARAPDPIED